MSFNPLESIARYRSSGGVGKSPGPESDAGSSLGDLRAYQATHSPRGKSAAGLSASPRLAMSQRRYGEQMEVRLELENEVTRLKKQVSALKGDNKKMEREVENSKDQVKAQKGKYEDIIAGLRNQLASKQHLTGAAGNTIHCSHLRNSGNGHLVSTVNEVISPTRFPPRESATPTSQPAYKNDKNENRPFNGHQQQQYDHNSHHNNSHQEPISSFQEPTFSELMRLSAKVTGPNETQCSRMDLVVPAALALIFTPILALTLTPILARRRWTKGYLTRQCSGARYASTHQWTGATR